MSRFPKKVEASVLIGEIALVRSAKWLNGNRDVAAIITDATVDPALLPDGAIALVSVVAFAPGSTGSAAVDLPLYDGAPRVSGSPAAFLKTRR